MCLGVPGRVVETYMDDEVAMAKVDFGGLTKRVCVAHVPEVAPGEYVLVHVGFALARIDEAEAKRTFELLEELKLVDATASQEVDATASQEVDATASQEVDATASQEVDATASQEVDATASQEVDATASQEVDATASQEVELGT